MLKQWSWLMLPFVLVLSGCPEDADGDGYTVEQGDCDDGDDAIYPGAPEVCDGLDNDCDGKVDPSCWRSAKWSSSTW